MFVLAACADDSARASGDAGGSYSGRRASLLTDVTAAEYQDLCDRLEGSVDLGTYVECSGSDFCQDCFDELLGYSDESTCDERIGTPEEYVQRDCTWTLGKLQDCLEERTALTNTLSCERPIRPGEESTCLSDFAEACTYSF